MGTGFSWKKLISALIPLAILGAIVAFDIPICPTRNLFGIPCPGCGLTRATEAAMHGDFWAMLRLHPLAPIFTPLFAFAIFRMTLVSAGLLKHQQWDWMSKVPRAIWIALGVALIGLWLARMVGMFGGLPDPVDFTNGWLYRGGHWVVSLFG